MGKKGMKGGGGRTREVGGKGRGRGAFLPSAQTTIQISHLIVHTTNAF